MEKEKIAAANNVYNQVPFSELLGSPLMACIDAQRSASQSSIDFIKSVGMAEGTGEMVNVSFYFQNGDETVTLVVPLLTIVPIPFFSVDTLDIDFNAMVDLSENAEGEEQFVGRYSRPVKESSKYEYDYYSNLNVHLHASKDHMPAGLGLLLNIMDKTIQVDGASPSDNRQGLPYRKDLTLNRGESLQLEIDEAVKQQVDELRRQEAGLTLLPETGQVLLSETGEVLRPEDVQELLPDGPVVWGCTRPDRVTVTPDGLIQAVGYGKGRVYARHEDGTVYAQWYVSVPTTRVNKPQSSGTTQRPTSSKSSSSSSSSRTSSSSGRIRFGNIVDNIVGGDLLVSTTTGKAPQSSGTTQQPTSSQPKTPSSSSSKSSSSSSSSSSTSSSSGRVRLGNIVDGIVGGDLLKSKASNRQAADVVEAVRRNAEGHLAESVEAVKRNVEGNLAGSVEAVKRNVEGHLAKVVQSLNRRK